MPIWGEIMKTRTWRCVLSAGVALALIADAAWATSSVRFNYQAKLTDSGGAPRQGSHTLFFSLWDGGTSVTVDSGTLLYTETTFLPITNGLVSHAVGTGTTGSPLTE